MRHVLTMLLVLAAMGCQSPGRSDLAQLDRMKSRSDPRVNAAETISCEARDLVCVQLLVARGSACLQLTEEADRAVARQRRQCALDDFAAARRQLPDQAPAEDLRKVLTGLASAQQIARDNMLDGAAAAALNADIAATASALQMVQGGGPSAAYFTSNFETFMAQRGVMPPAESCRILAVARSRLPSGSLPPDIAQRVPLLRTSIDALISNRSCP